MRWMYARRRSRRWWKQNQTTKSNAGSTLSRLKLYKVELAGVAALTLLFATVYLLFLLGFFARRVPLSEHVAYVESRYVLLNSSPYGVAVDGNRVFVSYPSSRVLAVADLDGNLVTVVKLDRPLTSIAAASGKLVGIDPRLGAVVVVSVEEGAGKVLGKARFVNPISVTVFNGSIVVYDSFHGCLYLLDLNGNVRGKLEVGFPLLGISGAEEGVWAVLPRNQTLALLSWSGLKIIRWFYLPTTAPYDVEWDGRRLWLVDYSSFEVLVIDPSRRVYRVVGREPPSWLPTLYLILLSPFILSALSKRR